MATMAALDLVDLMRAPYQLGGRDPATGLDCWGFVVAVRARLGLATPDPLAGARDLHDAITRGASAVAAGWTPARPDALRPGDLIVLPGFSGERTHAAVYLGGRPAMAAHFHAKGGQLMAWPKLRRFARDCWRLEMPLPC